MTTPYENLANAIILMAVKDYRSALKKLKKRPNYEPAKIIKNEVNEIVSGLGFDDLLASHKSVAFAEFEQKLL